MDLDALELSVRSLLAFKQRVEPLLPYLEKAAAEAEKAKAPKTPKAAE